MYHRLVEAVISLALLTLCLGTEDNSDTGVLDNDSEIYRFGASLAQNWDGGSEPYHEKVWLSRPYGYFMPDSEDDALLRSRREFYRFGRSQYPMEEKRFLRFGRSVDSVLAPQNIRDLIHTDPLYRMQSASDRISQSDGSLHRSRRSVSANGKASVVGDKDANNKYHKREAVRLDAKSDKPSRNVNAIHDSEDVDKRFMRFGKRFMRFGRNNDYNNDFEKRFMRFGRGNDDNDEYEKRFMRFGKRFMRFGRDNDYKDDYEKRFMRFGKRFMRFGRGLEDEENNEKRFMRFGKSGDDNNDDQKRFMRFGKRFMRFGKRFMRFGRQGEENNDQFLGLYTDGNNIDGVHAEKRSR